MAANDEPAGRPSLEERKLALEEAKLAHETSWPKKWGPLLLGGMFTGLITLSVTLIQIYATERARIQADSQQSIANTRAALEVYFGQLEAMDPASNARAANHMELIHAISQHPEVRAILQRLILETIEASRSEQRVARQMQGVAPSEVAQGLPDLVKKVAGEDYALPDFTAYIQYPACERAANKANELRMLLEELGMNTPPLERMGIDGVPNNDEIRFYRSLHKVQLAELPAILSERAGISFDAKVLPNGSQLPDGIVEFWLGRGSCR